MSSYADSLQPPRMRDGLPAISTGSLETYLQSLRRIPVLDADEERRLAQRMREQRDAAAARTLVLSNLRFAAQVARGYLDYGLPQADLIQQANLGLLKAVARFDPGVGVRLITFAVHWIKAEIQEFVLRNWRIVKMATTKAQRKLFFGLRRRTSRAGWLSPHEAGAIASELRVSTADVYGMESRFAAADLAFDASDAAAPPIADSTDRIAGVEEAQWSTRQRECLHDAIATLDARSRDILHRRWLSGERSASLEELGQEYGVSAERIRQIQNKALASLRAALEERGLAD